MPHTLSPIRYPGGKTSMFPLVEEKVTDTKSKTFIEPFCGGAGLSLMLLNRELVDNVWINDLEPAVFAMWHAFLYSPDEICDFVRTVPVTMDTWKESRNVLECHRNYPPAPDIILAKAALFLNRTNRSGILWGGVIGGKNQDGPYKLDARFTVPTLVKKIHRIHEWKDRIRLTGIDGTELVREELSTESFIFCDPPYVKRGPEMYGTSMSMGEHLELRNALENSPCHWMLTYDDHPAVRELYSKDDFDISVHGKWYTAQDRRIETELVVSNFRKDSIDLMD